MRRRRATLFTILLLAGLISSTALWLRAQRRQYAINRALIAALVKGDDTRALALVNEGADPNTHYMPMPVPSLVDEFKQLFHRSAPPINDSPTALLIACGAPWNDVVRQGSLGTPHRVQAMLRHGAKVNTKDEFGRNALFWSVYWKSEERIQLLLEQGADVNVLESHGLTALDWAVLTRSPKNVILQLLTHRADPNLANQQGATPLKWAQECNQPDIIALLKQYGTREPTKRP